MSSSQQNRNQSPRGTAVPQKKVTIQNQQPNNGGNSPPRTPKSPPKGNSSRAGGKSPPHSPSQNSRQVSNNQPSGRRQSPTTTSNQRASSKQIRKASPKSKQTEPQSQSPNKQVNPPIVQNLKQQNSSFYDKNEIKEALKSPKALEDYWSYQESVQRRVLEYKERADSNLRKISNYNDKLKKVQEKFFDFDSVRDEIFIYKSAKRYHKSETEDSFAMNTEEQQQHTHQKSQSPSQIRLSPSHIKVGTSYTNGQQSQPQIQLERKKSYEKQSLQYKIQKQEAYERVLNSKLKNDLSSYKNGDIQESQHLEKMGQQYFAQKDQDQLLHKHQINSEDALRLSHELYRESPPKKRQHKKVDLLQDSNPEEFQSYKERRNSTSLQQNDRFNTFQAYNNRRLEEAVQHQSHNKPNKILQFDRSALLTPEENELVALGGERKRNSPKISKTARDLSNEKNMTQPSSNDPNKLTNLQYKYLLDKSEYQKFLNYSRIGEDEYPKSSKAQSLKKQQNYPVSPMTHNNGLSQSDGKYRRKSITRLDTQQNDNYLRNHLGLTEDLNNIHTRKSSNHYPHTFQPPYQRGERNNTNESNTLPNIKENRRVSLDTNQISQNKYIRNMEIDNIFHNQQKRNTFQRYNTPTNKNYMYNK